ncbi:22 kDa peroxisomal membrane protein [Citrus sinensis]|uniref:22 kDa peroxisomal membrane protein n=1 Tax=Citrus sinensis TaxID=2711 RepID=A0ACB8IDV6_CITSI|nr:22 kDa peroxisomal membrane protein [Citrus sinensis]
MRGVLKRNGTVSQLLQSHGGGNNKKITDVFANPVANLNSNLLKNQTQSREYFKLADFLRKSTRAYNEVSPYSSLFSSAFAASSARTASFSEVGFVGWYLAMVKSRPVLTKSATCSLIYIAADLSSQTIASSESYDLVRTLRMGGYGMLILGESGEEIVARLKRDLLPTMFKGVMYWPVCDFITFRFTPVHLQNCYELDPLLL